MRIAGDGYYAKIINGVIATISVNVVDLHPVRNLADEQLVYHSVD